MYHSTLVILILNMFLFNISSCLYMKTTADRKNYKTRNDDSSKEEWLIFKQKLGLSNQKMELLKAQKDQKGTLELLNRFTEESPMYMKINAKQSKNYFATFYQNLLKQLKQSRSTLKTSLNIEFADKSQKKRSRRKIAFKMISDMPSEKIDDLLKMFNEKYGINNLGDDSEINKHEVEGDYSEFSINVLSSMDPDYMYENLYEDRKDLAAPTKSNQNFQYGSIQDLILQASRNQWHRPLEETKLRNPNSEHFI